MVRYAVYFVIFVLVLSGTFYCGYKVGAADTRVEYVTKEVEVVKYVSRERAEIQSRPNAGRDELIKLMYNNQL